MSTNISSVYDAFVTRIGAVLTSHVRLSNAYSIEENTEPALKLGWALQIGPAIKSPRHISCKISIVRTFNLVLTRKVYASELDATAKASTDKSLLEDQFLVIEDVEGEPTMGSAVVAKSNFLGDSGVEFVHTDKDNFIKLVSQFEVEYFEDLN